MLNKRVENGIISPANKRILLAFSIPKTPHQAMFELCLKKIMFAPYIKAGLLKCLNPEESRARFYLLTDKARKLLNQPPCNIGLHKDWNCIGWVMSGPKMKLVVLRCVDERKLYSEEIRIRAGQFNCHLSRTSVKGILKGLAEKHLVDTEIMQRVRFYWITPHGQKIKDELAVIAPLSQAS